ncbi:MAG: PKD domain-containing protein [Crocinitomicaceae bacterium]|nr:PKD domain-containing protein [Crocinitomicaceae bacterium]
MKKLLPILAGLLLYTGNINSQVSFDTNPTSGCPSLDVWFTNTSSFGSHYVWYYGDGGSDYDMFHGYHQYTVPGYYTVTMEVYDASWTYVTSEYSNVEVYGPMSYVMSNYEVACPNTQIEFFNPSPGYNFTIDFGDGNNLNSWNDWIEYTYSVPGTYNVSCYYYSTICNQYMTSYDVITIDAGLPWFGGFPGLNIYTSNLCPGETTGAHVNGGPFPSYSWSSGDGDISNDQYPQFTYENLGAYSMSVELINGCGIDTTLFGTVTVTNSVVPPSVGINGPTVICPGENFWLDVTTAPPGLTYTWDFGDGTNAITSTENYAYHTYDNAGTYIVQLTAENSCGNTSSSNYTVTADPGAPVLNPGFGVVNPNACPGDEVHFWVNGDYDFYIDFGDGSGAANSYEHTYTTPGVYSVYCIIQNLCGQTAVLYDVVTISNNVFIPNSVYAGAQSSACPNTNVEFYAESGYTDYLWNFGDGVTLNSQEVMHPYANAGSYNASVTITNGCGNDTTLNFNVQIFDNLPVQDLDWVVYTTGTSCPGSEVFMSSGSNDAIEFEWDFGDGNTSTDQLTSHEYPNVGTYTITLTATNGCGSDTTVTQNITIANGVQVPGNVLEFEAQNPGCVGDNLYFAVIPAGLGTYSWDFGDGNSGLSDELIYVEEQPIAVGFHAYSNAGTYSATLTVTNECGNTFDSTITVQIGDIGQPTTLDVFFWTNQLAPMCEGEPVEFFGVGAGTYVWDFGDGSGNLITYTSLDPVYHTYEDDGAYTVSVQGYNACGGSDLSVENIFIPNSDLAVVTNTVAEADCGVNNGVAIVSASGGTPPYEYTWTNGDEGVLADSLGSGIYVVSIVDNNGCSTEATATVSDSQGPVILLENIVHNECYGQDNGVISVSVLGGAPPYEILWSNGDNSEDIFGLEAGPYEIYVTDANGCFAVESYTVEQPIESVVSVYTESAVCGANDGVAYASVNNGTPPYNYIWPNTSGSASSTGGLAPGVYNLMVIDGNTCLLQHDFVVNEVNGAIIVTDSISDPTCSGDLSAIYISTIGGDAPFTYSWSNGSTSQDLTGVIPGEYSVEVEGNDGCSSFMIFNVEMSAPEETNICMVTVDTTTNSNIVVWVPVNAPDVVSYNIYKESSQSGLYYLVANQSADSISQYYDYPSNPAIKSWRYKVAAVDDCGNEAELSDPHKTIHLTSNLGVGNVVNLIWDHYNGFNYDTYYIHRYHPSTGWETIDSVGSMNISYTDLTPPSDSNLVYIIEVIPPTTCTAFKVQDHNSSRSNKSTVNAPEFDDSGLDELTTDLSIYPNPTSGNVQLMYSTVISQVKLFDMSGKLVFEASNSTNLMTIDCSELSRGVYTVQLLTENGMIQSKLVKQ